jgi:hypothetical protein
VRFGTKTKEVVGRPKLARVKEEVRIKKILAQCGLKEKRRT